MWYLLTWIGTKNITYPITIYGPYKTAKSVINAGRKWEAKHAGNPCWQVMEGDPTIITRPASAL